MVGKRAVWVSMALFSCLGCAAQRAPRETTSSMPVASAPVSAPSPSVPAASASALPSPAAVPPAAASAQPEASPLFSGQPIEVAREPSRFGRFGLRCAEQNVSCTLTFQRGSEAPHDLFEVSDCGMVTLSAVTYIAPVSLPVSNETQEIHLFSIPTARGGNAIHTDDFYAVIVTDSAVDAKPVGELGSASAEVSSAHGLSLLLTEPATTTAAGQSFSVGFQRLLHHELPMLPSKLVSKTRETVTGVLEPAYHVTAWKPTIGGRVFEPSPRCKLDSFYSTEVTMMLEVKTFDDERIEATCLSIRKAASSP
ncbi:MAG: hypothetical protein QM756_43055 [Polyangiaceae bacterium]